jgi:hypothetical protein
MTFSIKGTEQQECHYAEYSYAACRDFLIMLNIVMLNAFMLNAIILSVVMLNVLAPKKGQ